MANPVLTRHFQVFMKGEAKPEAFARAVYSAIFPSDESNAAQPAVYPFRVLDEIKWEERGQVWDDILGEFLHQGVRIEITYDRTSRNIATWKIQGKQIEVGPISPGSSEYKLVAAEAIGKRLLTVLIMDLLFSQTPEARLKHLLSTEDPDLVHSRIYAAISSENAQNGLALAEKYVQQMPEYEEAIVKNMAYHFQLKKPSVALEYLFRGLALGIAARGPSAKCDYCREILKAYLSLHDLATATQWVNDCCADAALIDFYKAELCIDMYGYIQYNRKSDADLNTQLLHWANRCVNKFNNPRLQRALNELNKGHKAVG